jgi:hypothetical protein
VSGVPHSPQNWARVSVSPPHWEQLGFRGVPHSMQNLAPAGVSASQCGQRIDELSGTVVRVVVAWMGRHPHKRLSEIGLRWCVSTPHAASCQVESATSVQTLERRREVAAPRTSPPTLSSWPAPMLRPHPSRPSPVELTPQTYGDLGRPRDCIYMTLSPSGCRSTSSTWRRNSGSSSRKSTPLWASDTSPGIGTWPPPISPTSEIV